MRRQNESYPIPKELVEETKESLDRKGYHYGRRSEALQEFLKLSLLSYLESKAHRDEIGFNIKGRFEKNFLKITNLVSVSEGHEEGLKLTYDNPNTREHVVVTLKNEQMKLLDLQELGPITEREDQMLRYREARKFLSNLRKRVKDFRFSELTLLDILVEAQGKTPILLQDDKNNHLYRLGYPVGDNDVSEFIFSREEAASVSSAEWTELFFEDVGNGGPDHEMVSAKTFEQREQLPEYSVTIDRSILANAGEKIPESLRSLPEQLNFKPGLQLVVGLNGSGKSTLLDALHFANFSTLRGRTPTVTNDYGTDEHYEHAAHLATAITINTPARTLRLDVANGISRMIERAQEGEGIERLMKKSSKQITELKRLSTRQQRDHYFEDQRNLYAIDHFKGIVFIDEFETGIDPWRHQEILKEIKNYVNNEAIVILATNSPILTFSSIPRLDLRTPERGIIEG